MWKQSVEPLRIDIYCADTQNLVVLYISGPINASTALMKLFILGEGKG